MKIELEQVDDLLKDWVKNITKVSEVSFSLDGVKSAKASVNLYLLSLGSKPPARGTNPAPLQFLARYLVTTSGSDMVESHRLLGNLVFAALEDTRFDVDLQPISADTWLALKVLPQPAFVLEILVQRERPLLEAPLIQAPLVVKAVITSSFYGLVLNSDGIPLAGASVELPSLQLSTHTDVRGYFSFSKVPSEPPTKQLRVKFKGWEQVVTTDSITSDKEPFVIHFVQPKGK
jgi:hypothetical protein